ncbi:hypothetical protein JHK82_042122 [Glycine max]|nr:hypothetical protein JHK82_042122 [Glycine max]
MRFLRSNAASRSSRRSKSSPMFVRKKKTPLPSKPKPRNPLPPRSRAWARSESNALPNKAPPPNVT